MTKEQIVMQIEKIDEEIKALKENRCDQLICITNEHEKSLRIQDLLERRTELHYLVDFDPSLKGVKSKGKMTAAQEGYEMKARHAQKVEIAKNLLDVLEDEMIAIKTGLSVGEVNALR